MEARKLIALVILAAFSTVVSAKTCPQKYARFTPNHSFCLDPNPQCSVLKQGVDNAAIQEILNAHNKLRSKVATGQENEAGGLPTAANMLQMEWDPELAAVAQGWANQCMFKHDCKECRQVERFKVGQNAAIQMTSCSSSACHNSDWTSRVDKWYGEVPRFNKKSISPFVYQDGYGHFTQVVWAESSKVGCGYVAYKGTKYATEKIYVCNYGPTGNMKNAAMYKAGAPCSACPSGTSCKGSFPGLCTAVQSSSSGRSEEKKRDYLLNCKFGSKNSNCKFHVDGNTEWSLLSSPIVQLQPGAEKTLQLLPTLKPTSNFCLQVTFMKGPVDDSRVDLSTLVLYATVKNERKVQILKSHSVNSLSSYLINYSLKKETEIELRLSVPKDAPEHFLDIKEIVAYSGNCEF